MKSLLRYARPAPRQWRWPQVPLLWVLVLPFVAQLAGSVGLVAYVSYRSAQRDLETVAENLRAQASHRIYTELDQRLQEQQATLEVTYEALQQAQWPLGDEARVRQILWQQMQFVPTLSSVYLATEQNLEVGYGRLLSSASMPQVEALVGRSLSPHTPFLVHRDPAQPQERYFSLVDGQGQPQEPLYQQALPVRDLAWYQMAQALPDQGWSAIFPIHTTAQFSISALRPLRDAEGRFEGTLASFFLLEDLSAFLGGLNFSPTGQAFILERSGAVVASSLPEPPYQVDSNVEVSRLYAQQSTDPWLRAVAEHLAQGHDGFDHLPNRIQTTLTVEGTNLYVDVQTYQDAYGLDWLVVLLLPATDLTANVRGSQSRLLGLWGGTLLVATAIGWITARLIMTRLRRLAEASQALAEGSPEPILETTAVAELTDLTETFNRMAQTIQTSQVALTQSIADLQASQSRFRSLFQADVVGLLVVDLEGRILEANDYVLTLLGYDRLALTEGTLRWDDITPTDYQRQDQRAVAQLRHQGWINAYEKEYYHREGHRVPVLIGGAMVGQSGEVVCVMIDLQERKRVEQALQESQSFLQHITDASPDILYVYDMEERRNRYVSGAVKEILGYSVQEAMDTDFFTKLLPPNQWAQLVQDYTQLETLADGEIRSNKLMIQTASGERRWGFNRYTVFSRDAEGRVTQTIGSVQDITVLKQAEAETQQLKERLEFILASTPAAIFTCGLDYTITFFSQNITVLTGYSPEEFIGQRDIWIQGIHPEDIQRVFDGMDQFFQRGHWVHEYRWRHRAGYYLWMRNDLRLICDAQGQPQEIVGSCIDVSLRRQAEIALQQTNVDLRRATRMKDEFLAAMSHELRTPLTAILGMTEALMEEVFGPVTPQQIQALTTLDSSGSHLLQLINDILDVSKLESGQMTLDLGAPLEVAQLCAASLAFVQPQAKAKAIQLDLHLAATLPPLPLDERRMRQVLINLLGNAVKFTPDGGQVVLEASMQGTDPAYLCLAVRDTGIGITEADQARVFDPFIQIDSALNRKYEGTGLGLGLVKRLVELHGGHLTLASTPGEGSCFTVYLPYPTPARPGPPLTAASA